MNASKWGENKEISCHIWHYSDNSYMTTKEKRMSNWALIKEPNIKMLKDEEILIPKWCWFGISRPGQHYW